MIQTFSSTIRRKEMDAVLTCMVDEKIGPGEINARLIQTVKEFFSCAGAVALRSPAIAVKYALKAMNLEPGTTVMVSALSPSWLTFAIEENGYSVLVLDVDEATAQVTADIVADGIQKGGRLLILSESLGIMPEAEKIVALGIPVIEDVSQSAGAFVENTEAEGSEQGAQNANNSEEKKEDKTDGKKAGSFGVFTICGLEEHDVITAGGGALLMAASRRDWPVLKTIVDAIPSVEMLPDINAALALVQLKEYGRNEQTRKEFLTLFTRAVMAGKNKTFVREADDGSTAWSFPLILNSGFRDVKQYTQKKEIEIQLAFENSIISVRQDTLFESCKTAKALYLRTALFPLYPRLHRSQVEKITKVLGTLP